VWVSVWLQVKGKVNAITLDNCSKTGLLFDTVVSSCEVVNSSSVEVQCTGNVPTVAIDKCDGCQASFSLLPGPFQHWLHILPRPALLA
jgi:adenylyl cyclase-associated protein